jgi:hypothetical protein
MFPQHSLMMFSGCINSCNAMFPSSGTLFADTGFCP